MVRAITIFSLLICFAATCLAQDAQSELLKFAEFEKLILTKDRFTDVPPKVRSFHAVGTMTAILNIDADGKLEKLFVTGVRQVSFLHEYVETEIGTWKFKPLKRKGKQVAYRGVISIPFCYGTFPKKRWC